MGYWAWGFLQVEIIRVDDIGLVKWGEMRHFINAIDPLAQKQSKKFNYLGINPNSDTQENLFSITIGLKVISSQ